MPNKVIFSRIQNRRGPLENLPQPLRPGEIALTSDARRVFIGNEDVAPFGIRTLTPAVPVGPTSLIQKSLTERIVSIVFDAELSQLQYEQLVDFLSRENNQLFPPFVAPGKFTLITGQTESDYFGSFSGGSNYNVNDVITLNNGARLTVTSEAAGVVDGFTVDFRGAEAIEGVTITQQSVSPEAGESFTLTPAAGNITPAPSPDKATFYNASQQVLWDQKRSVFIGLRVSELELALEKSLQDANIVVLDTRKGSDSYDGSPGQGTDTPGSRYVVGEEITLNNNAVVRVNAVSTTQTLVSGQQSANFDGDPPNGFAAGGSGYTVGDQLTLSNGDIVTVNLTDGGGSAIAFEITAVNGIAVAGAPLTATGGTGNDDFALTPGLNNLTNLGDILEFSIIAQGDSFVLGTTLIQDSTVGTGTGFTITPDSANVLFKALEETIVDVFQTLPGILPPREVRIAEREFLPAWQGPVTTAKIRNFSNPLLTSLASGNVAKLINLVSASSLLLDTTQDHLSYNNIGDNGTFTGGQNYSVGDVITLNNGTTVVVNTESGGEVASFDIVVQGAQVIENFPLQQKQVVDSVGDPSPGTAFTLTPRDNNLILVVSDETLSLVTTVTNIEIGVVDIFDETEFPSDLLFEQFDYQVVLDNPVANLFPTGIEFPRTQSDSVFIEYTLRSLSYAATGNIRLSDFGGNVSVSDQRNTNSILIGDITLTADFVGVGQRIRVLYTNTTGTDYIVLKMIVRRWNSA